MKRSPLRGLGLACLLAGGSFALLGPTAATAGNSCARELEVAPADTSRALERGPDPAGTSRHREAVSEPGREVTLAPPMDIVEGGAHWRLETSRGPLHVWLPPGFAAASAGVVVYVHGYYNTVDEAWTDHRLAAQFRASGRNALYVVPEAPVDGRQEVLWFSLSELIETARAAIGLAAADGPVIVVGHSGAFRTVEGWLGEPRLHEIILLDGLYASSWPFRDWLRQRVTPTARRLTLVGLATRRRCRRLAREIQGAVRLPRVPATPTELGQHARSARLLVMDSQYAHMELVTEGRVIPLLLRLTDLLRL